MSWTYRHLTCILLLLFAFSGIAKGQQSVAYPSAEKVQLITDRSLYIAGESLYFSAVILAQEEQYPQLSQVLYAEIISADLRQVVGGKFKITHQSVSGSLIIPKDIISGFYYLRVYTKYMRNLGPTAYNYVGLKIINPTKTDLISGNDTLCCKITENNSNLGSDAFSISSDKEKYSTRDSVFILVEANNLLIKDFRQLNVSVIPDQSVFEYPIDLSSTNQSINNLIYYPETRGLTISGTLKDAATGNPISDTRISLSIIGEGRDFMAILTDSSGRFMFSLPDYHGDRDIFLCAENVPGIRSEILVDNDFCALPLQLPSPVFELTEKERKQATQMAANARISDLFDLNKNLSQNVESIDNTAFYGTPTGIIVFDDFVALPSLEEYFNELPTQVKVRRKDGKPYFKVIGAQAEMLVYDPLVMVDWVVVDDPESVLKTSPKEIAHIEVINETYIKGNITYGGIVNIITKYSDFASIDLPESGIFIRFNLLDNNTNMVQNAPALQNIPDARNTLYWDPNLKLDKNAQKHFSFSTPDTPGTYEVIVRGINHNGEILLQKAFFEVLQKK